MLDERYYVLDIASFVSNFQSDDKVLNRLFIGRLVGEQMCYIDDVRLAAK